MLSLLAKFGSDARDRHRVGLLEAIDKPREGREITGAEALSRAWQLLSGLDNS